MSRNELAVVWIIWKSHTIWKVSCGKNRATSSTFFVDSREEQCKFAVVVRAMVSLHPASSCRL